jgi:hypothetical protein
VAPAAGAGARLSPAEKPAAASASFAAALRDLAKNAESETRKAAAGGPPHAGAPHLGGPPHAGAPHLGGPPHTGAPHLGGPPHAGAPHLGGPLEPPALQDIRKVPQFMG